MLTKSTRALSDQEIPDEIYVSLVKSLYVDPRTLIVGSLGTIGAALLTVILTGQMVFAALTGALAIIALVRAFDMRTYKLKGQSAVTREEIRPWEIRYVAGASIYILLMGIWCLLAFTNTTNPVVQLLCFSMTLVNMIGVAGRNYGSRLLVTSQLTCAGLPMLAGLFLMGDSYYAIVGCVLAPFFLSFKVIADRLRLTLASAVTSAQNVGVLAARLDVALNSMAHGLCMFDRSGRITLMNTRLPDILGGPFKTAENARSIFKFVLQCRAEGLIKTREIQHMIAALRGCQNTGRETNLTVPLMDNRNLSLSFRPAGANSTIVVVEDVTEKMNAESKIRQLAHYDSLTGLPNRTLLRIEVDRLLHGGSAPESFAILFIDLDHFKQVNDTLGHPAGDKLLQQVAARLKAVTKSEDIIARLGGDEFVVVRPLALFEGHLEELCKNIVDELARPYQIYNNAVVIGASIGMAVSPENGIDADALLRNADLALYSAKSEGRGVWRCYKVEMAEQALDRRSLELEMRKALESDGFELYFQPIVDIRTSRIVSCEALLRWTHPERGPIAPSVFIPIAEEIGLISDLGRMVLSKACRAATAWPRHVGVAVNISTVQFRHGDVVADVQSALQASGLDASRLEVEVTESVLLHDHIQALATLNRFRDLGVKISLDDFGTGYSSLSYLQSFPLQKVKIDRSFLHGIAENQKSKVLLSGIARLCSELEITVVVEGIETEQQLSLIAADQHITQAQGYLFGRPMPFKATCDLLMLFGHSGADNLERDAAAADELQLKATG